ncbi:MAG TPA: PAS-domain containing protein [Methylocella sp.]|nr:PAS-domain containing protein [Methylocella sp.]
MDWRSRPRIQISKRMAGLYTALALIVLPLAALGTESRPQHLEALVRLHDRAAELILLIGLAAFSVFVAWHSVRERRRLVDNEAVLEGKLMDLRARLDLAEAFLGADSQIFAVFAKPDQAPEITGNLSLAPMPLDSGRLLAFESWLPPSQATCCGQALAQLRESGRSFRLSATGLDERLFEIEGRPVGGLAVLRVKDVSAERQEVARLQRLQASTLDQVEALRALLDAVPYPAWLRNGEGQLSFVNAAYARAVEAKTAEMAVLGGIELVERQAREASAAARRAGQIWHGRAPAVVAGQRRMLEIVDAPAGSGSAGMAADVSEIAALRAELDQQSKAHVSTLDRLSTAVAIFDGAKELIFHNAAYRQLFTLDPNFLDQKPTFSEILDWLRAARLLPEQADFRAWKADLLAAYQSMETQEQNWHLPDGRTLRVVTSPDPQGGLIYLFDDVTERYHLWSQYNASIRVQSETLDALKEGVAVFGSDGRLKLFNPAFAGLWALAAAELGEKPHIDQVMALCTPLFADEEIWGALRAAIAGLPDQRLSLERRLARSDGSVLDCAAAPLPDGATLLTFIDTTASVNVERALTERNQALIDAEKLRNDFVHHVSYELRSPLTNIIGFIQMLDNPAIGPLNAKQREYAGYVMKSSAALLAIINDILDLASIDADAMELALSEVDIAQTIRAAAEGVQDRLAESALTLRVQAMDAIGSFVADEKRIRQILFNLLSNAIGFSSPGQTIELAAERQGDEILFTVTDQGSGIPPEVREHVFDRFKTYTAGSRHRGTGLGLSIVQSFVELHGGRIKIDSVLGKGTRAACFFPANGGKAAAGSSRL